MAVRVLELVYERVELIVVCRSDEVVEFVEDLGEISLCTVVWDDSAVRSPSSFEGDYPVLRVVAVLPLGCGDVSLDDLVLFLSAH